MNGKPKKPVDPLSTIVEADCPVCGKRFVPAPYHVYKYHDKWYCSWSCYGRRFDLGKKK